MEVDDLLVWVTNSGGARSRVPSRSCSNISKLEELCEARILVII
jgi:hypothetical protein